MKIDVSKLVRTCFEKDRTRRNIYDPKLHVKEFLIKSARGATVIQIASDFSVDVYTLYNWCRVHEEFNRAFRLGRQLALSHYFELAQDNMQNKQFNGNLWTYFVARCFNTKFPESFTSKNSFEKCDEINKRLINDEISFEHAKSWVDLISTESSIEEKTELAKVLEKLEAAEKQ